MAKESTMQFELVGIDNVCLDDGTNQYPFSTPNPTFTFPADVTSVSVKIDTGQRDDSGGTPQNAVDAYAIIRTDPDQPPTSQPNLPDDPIAHDIDGPDVLPNSKLEWIIDDQPVSPAPTPGQAHRLDIWVLYPNSGDVYVSRASYDFTAVMAEI